MTTLVSIDPGKATGVVFGRFDDKTPFTVMRTEVMLFQQFSDFVRNGARDFGFIADVLVVERFRLLQGNEFAADLSGLKVEGVIDHALRARIELVNQFREDKALVSDQVLKDNGLWYTGTQVGWDDGRDVNDAIIHALVYLRRKRHMPTLLKYFRGEEDD